jgi:tetratricopeptide (TPR) repeat protein
MTSSHSQRRICQTAVCVIAICVVATMMSTWLPPVQAQSSNAGGASVQGFVYAKNSNGQPVADAVVTLASGTEASMPGLEASTKPARVTHSNADGAYHFVGVPDGTYTLQTEKPGYTEFAFGPIILAPKETKTVDLYLDPKKPSELSSADPQHEVTKKPAKQAPEFFDEPQFTVAGVTQATNAGGHGSDTVLRTTEALAKATLSLNSESKQDSAPAMGATERSLQDAITQNPRDAALHHQLAEVEEKLGNPLTAVREYQRAAELDPTEPNLFDWGTELLTHRALEPATEVFAKGNHLFPASVRTLVALGVTWYARGSYEQAALCMANASDLAPTEPTPYLFLGKMQSAQITPLEGSRERLARFAALHPENALANYYYAVSLWKQSGTEAEDGSRTSAQVESLLQKATHLDPKLEAAYLQLGMLYAQRGDFSRAIPAFQKAIDVSDGSSSEAGSERDDSLQAAHYRLAQAYSRLGDKIKAQEQLYIYTELTKKIKEDTEREHRQIQEFVISLRKQDSTSPPKN